MDSGKHLFKALLGKKPESQLSQEDGQPSATPSPAVAWGQPSAQSSSQQVLQTQDWIPARDTRRLRKTSVVKKSKALGKKEPEEPGAGNREPGPVRPAHRMEEGVSDEISSVCEPPESRRPSRRWSVSISERRRLAALGGCERPEHADAKPTPTPSGRDLPRIVAELVSQGVDKDVLLPCPPRSTESTNAFHAFLVRSAPFWRNMTLEAQASRSPPS